MRAARTRQRGRQIYLYAIVSHQQAIASRVFASRALAVHQVRAVLLVLLLAHPHLLERPERREDGTADPGGEFPLDRVLGRRHLHPHVSGRRVVKLRLQPLP